MNKFFYISKKFNYNLFTFQNGCELSHPDRRLNNKKINLFKKKI